MKFDLKDLTEDKELKIRSNLGEVSKSEKNAKGSPFTFKEETEIINLDQLKEWFCEKYIKIGEKKSSMPMKSCDAFYYSPLPQKKKHVLLEFKNVSKNTFYQKEFCEGICQKIFESRSILLHTIFANKSIDDFKKNMEMVVIYHSETSAKDTEAGVKKLRDVLQSKKKTEKIDYEQRHQEAESNIEKIKENYREWFSDFYIVNAKDFQEQYEAEFSRFKCKFD